MRKKNNLALYTLLIAGLLSLFTINISAQNKVWTENNQLQKSNPEIILLQKYIEMSALPSGKKQKFFSDVSNKEKAGIFKLHLALQFIKRPELTKEQRAAISEALLMVSPDTYDKSNLENNARTERNKMEFENKLAVVFSQNEAFEIFANLGNAKEEVPILQKYLDVVLLPSMLQRRKSFRESFPTDKSNTIKAQMAYYLATYKLTKVQQDFLLDAILLAVPDAFSNPNDKSESRTDAKKALDFHGEKALKLFSQDEVYKMFMSIGSKGITISPDWIDPGGPPTEEDCGCVWLCGPCMVCKKGGCAETTSGCGIWLDSACTGSCTIDIRTCP